MHKGTILSERCPSVMLTPFKYLLSLQPSVKLNNSHEKIYLLSSLKLEEYICHRYSFLGLWLIHPLPLFYHKYPPRLHHFHHHVCQCWNLRHFVLLLLRHFVLLLRHYFSHFHLSSVFKYWGCCRLSLTPKKKGEGGALLDDRRKGAKGSWFKLKPSSFV